MTSETYPISGATKRPDLGNVGILGAYATRVGLSVGTPEAMAREAAWGALRNASLEPGDVAAVIVGNALGGSLADQANMRGQSWLGAMAGEVDGIAVVTLLLEKRDEIMLPTA